MDYPKYAIVTPRLQQNPRRGYKELAAELFGTRMGNIILLESTSYKNPPTFSPLPGTTWLVKIGNLIWKDPKQGRRFQLMEMIPVACISQSPEIDFEFVRRGTEWVDSRVIGNLTLDFTPSYGTQPNLREGRNKWKCYVESESIYMHELDSGAVNVIVRPMECLNTFEEIFPRKEPEVRPTLAPPPPANPWISGLLARADRAQRIANMR
jgi:hypothetical protein